MRRVEKNIPIKTIPDGAYETGTTNQELQRDETEFSHDPGVDAQGNGYPTLSKSKNVKK